MAVVDLEKRKTILLAQKLQLESRAQHITTELENINRLHNGVCASLAMLEDMEKEAEAPVE